MIVANATGCSSIYGANLRPRRGPSTPRAEAGLEQLAVRRQRRVRSGHAPRPRRPVRPGATAADRARSDGRRGARPRAARRRAGFRAGDRAPARPRARLRGALARIDGPDRVQAQHLLALAGDLVRKGIWIVGGDGWAYDIGFAAWTRSSAPAGTSISWSSIRRSTRTRRPGVEGHAARAVAKFGLRQGHGEEGSRRDRPCLRQRLRRQIAMGATTPTPPGHFSRPTRGRTIARHRLQHVHRPRHRHDQVDVSPARRGEERLLAPVQVPASEAKADSPSTWTRRASIRSGLRGDGDTLRDPRANEPQRAAELAALAQADANERWRYYEQLAACIGASRTLPARPTWRPPARPRAPAPRRTRRDHRSAHQVPRPGTALADRASASPSTGDPERYASSMRQASARSSCRPCSRKRSERGNRAEPLTGGGLRPVRGSPRVLPDDRGFRRCRRALPGLPAADQVPLDGAGDRQPQPTTTGGWVRYARLMQEAGADRSSSTSIESLPTRARRLPKWRRPTSMSSPQRLPRPRSPGRQAQPVLLALANFASRAVGVALPAGPVQPLLPAGPGPRNPGRREPRGPEPAGGPEAVSALDRDSPTQLGPNVSLAAAQESRRAPTWSRSSWSGRRRHDDLGVAAPRPRLRPHRGG